MSGEKWKDFDPNEMIEIPGYRIEQVGPVWVSKSRREFAILRLGHAGMVGHLGYIMACHDLKQDIWLTEEEVKFENGEGQFYLRIFKSFETIVDEMDVIAKREGWVRI